MEMLSGILNQPRSLELVLGNDVSRAAALIRGARRVVVTGMGASLNAAMLLAHHLGCIAIDAGELLHFHQEMARDAVVILVSRSGETVEAVRLLPKLRAAGATVIGVTNEPGTTVAREADLALLVNSAGDDAVAVQTYTGTAMLMLLLAAAVSGMDVSAAAKQIPARMSGTIAETRGLTWEWLKTIPVIYVLGRGPSAASAHEGALLFNETAKLPSVAMSAGNFRHGPVEVVDSTFGAFLFASDSRTRDLDDALEANLTRMGGRVHTVRVEPGYFAPVLEIVPLQFAAYHAAGLRGFEPGRFRHVSVVTASETEFP